MLNLTVDYMYTPQVSVSAKNDHTMTMKKKFLLLLSCFAFGAQAQTNPKLQAKLDQEHINRAEVIEWRRQYS